MRSYKRIFEKRIKNHNHDNRNNNARTTDNRNWVSNSDHSSNSNTFEFTIKKKAIIKERFEIKSIDGINAAGKTNKLDNLYIILLWFRQEDIC